MIKKNRRFTRLKKKRKGRTVRQCFSFLRELYTPVRVHSSLRRFRDLARAPSLSDLGGAAVKVFGRGKKKFFRKRHILTKYSPTFCRTSKLALVRYWSLSESVRPRLTNGFHYSNTFGLAARQRAKVRRYEKAVRSFSAARRVLNRVALKLYPQLVYKKLLRASGVLFRRPFFIKSQGFYKKLIRVSSRGVFRGFRHFARSKMRRRRFRYIWSVRFRKRYSSKVRQYFGRQGFMSRRYVRRMFRGRAYAMRVRASARTRLLWSGYRTGSQAKKDRNFVSFFNSRRVSYYRTVVGKKAVFFTPGFRSLLVRDLLFSSLAGRTQKGSLGTQSFTTRYNVLGEHHKKYHILFKQRAKNSFFYQNVPLLRWQTKISRAFLSLSRANKLGTQSLNISGQTSIDGIVPKIKSSAVVLTSKVPFFVYTKSTYIVRRRKRRRKRLVLKRRRLRRRFVLKMHQPVVFASHPLLKTSLWNIHQLMAYKRFNSFLYPRWSSKIKLSRSFLGRILTLLGRKRQLVRDFIFRTKRHKRLRYKYISKIRYKFKPIRTILDNSKYFMRLQGLFGSKNLLLSPWQQMWFSALRTFHTHRTRRSYKLRYQKIPFMTAFTRRKTRRIRFHRIFLRTQKNNFFANTWFGVNEFRRYYKVSAGLLLEYKKKKKKKKHLLLVLI